MKKKVVRKEVFYCRPTASDGENKTRSIRRENLVKLERDGAQVEKLLIKIMEGLRHTRDRERVLHVDKTPI